MALARPEGLVSTSIVLSRTGEISTPPIEVPLRAEMVRIIGNGRGIDLRYDLRDLGLVPGIDGYRDYEVYAFERKVAQAEREGEECTYYGPLITDLILPSYLFGPEIPEVVRDLPNSNLESLPREYWESLKPREFSGLNKWDFFKLVGHRLAEVVEVKTAREFREEYRDKRDKLPQLMEKVKDDFSSRIKKVVTFTYVPEKISIDPSQIPIRFISITPQTGKTNFERPMTPHEAIEPTEEIIKALLRTEQARREKAEARRLKPGIIVEFPKAAA